MDMDVIKADNIGINFKFKRGKKGSLRETMTGLFSGGQNKINRFWALRGVSLVVGKGETLGIIGRNGSGKSTLLRLIGGIYTPDEGRIEVHGKVSLLLSAAAGFQPELSGIENIYLNGILLGLRKEEVDELFDSIVDFAELGDFINMPVRTYSSGMYSRLGFSIAVNVKGDILLLDEVMGAGDARFSVKARQKMEELLTEGRTIVLASHNMDIIKRFANKVVCLDRGRVVAQGDPEEVVNWYLSS